MFYLCFPETLNCVFCEIYFNLWTSSLVFYSSCFATFMSQGDPPDNVGKTLLIPLRSGRKSVVFGYTTRRDYKRFSCSKAMEMEKNLQQQPEGEGGGWVETPCNNFETETSLLCGVVVLRLDSGFYYLSQKVSRTKVVREKKRRRGGWSPRKKTRVV